MRKTRKTAKPKSAVRVHKKMATHHKHHTRQERNLQATNYVLEEHPELS